MVSMKHDGKNTPKYTTWGTKNEHGGAVPQNGDQQKCPLGAVSRNQQGDQI